MDGGAAAPDDRLIVPLGQRTCRARFEHRLEGKARLGAVALLVAEQQEGALGNGEGDVHQPPGGEIGRDHQFRHHRGAAAKFDRRAHGLVGGQFERDGERGGVDAEAL